VPEEEIQQLLGRSISSSERAEWGFQNRTDLVTLGTGERIVVQRYRRREDAEYRVRAMQGLHGPAATSGIAIPRVREADLDADPPWVAFDALPGEPIPAVGLDDPRFPGMARAMGDLLAAFRTLSTAGLDLDDRWASPSRLAAHASTGRRASRRHEPSPSRSPRCSRDAPQSSRTVTSLPSMCSPTGHR
jgi:hypothetical protein